ncbi:MAG: stage sporulation protein [Clostridiales bacterium]|jgi:stage III sporulation protein AB|nr:stage sporulation protein [Clostridiales bacterium]
MFILKIIGSGVILTSSTAIGFKMAQKLQDDVDQTEELIHALIVWQTKIKHTHTLVYDLFNMIRFKDASLNNFFNKVKERLNERSGLTLKEITDDEIKKSDIEHKTKNILSDLLKNLGHGDVEINIALINETIELLKEHKQKQLVISEKFGKIYSNLGVLSGVGLIIFLVF